MGILGEILVCATIGFALTAVITVSWRCLTECEKWRRSCGRSNFWPLIH